MQRRAVRGAWLPVVALAWRRRSQMRCMSLEAVCVQGGKGRGSVTCVCVRERFEGRPGGHSATVPARTSGAVAIV